MRNWIDIISNGILTEGRDAYLFHGTDLLGAIGIIRDNKIDAGQHYAHHVPGVSLAREYVVARDFGTYWERICPVVFVLDQNKIVQSKMKIAPYRDTSEPGVFRDRESEELVHGDIAPLNKYLVSVNVDIDHLEAALKSKEFWEAERNEKDEYIPYLKTRSTFIRMINRYIVRHPLLNRWVPRVAYKPGTKDHGKPWIG